MLGKRRFDRHFVKICTPHFPDPIFHTAKVKDLVNRMMRQGALWQDCGDGWEALESSVKLSGWTQQRVAEDRGHHGAMERRATLVANFDPGIASLAGRKVASRPPGGGRTAPKRMKITRLAVNPMKNQPPPSEVLNEHAHFPF